MSCKPNHLSTKLKKSWAIPFASTVLEQGARITPLVRPWSTATMTESSLEESGRSVIRSTDSCLKGRVTEEGMGDKGEVTG